MPMDHHIGLATFLHNDRPWFKIFCNVSPQPGTNVYIEWRFSPHRVPLLFSSGIGKLCQNEIWDSSKLCDAVHWLLSDMSPIIVYPCRQLTHWFLVLTFERCDPGWWRCQVDTWKYFFVIASQNDPAPVHLLVHAVAFSCGWSWCCWSCWWFQHLKESHF